MKQSVGPGTYHKDLSWVKNQKIRGKEMGQPPKFLQNLVQENAPSIPSHNNIFGYEENERGDLIR